MDQNKLLDLLKSFPFFTLISSALLRTVGKSLFAIRLHLKKEIFRFAFMKAKSSPESLRPHRLPAGGRQQPQWWPDVVTCLAELSFHPYPNLFLVPAFLFIYLIGAF